MNVRFSPITTRGIPYSSIAPVHIAHGDSVVYMVGGGRRWRREAAGVLEGVRLTVVDG